MGAYIIRRLLLMIPTLLVISFVTFSIIKLPPGDFLTNQIAELRSQGDKAALERVEFLRKQYGLDKPFLEQYAVWVEIWPKEVGTTGKKAFSGLLQGDWGWSFEHDLPVNQVIGDRMLLSFMLNFTVVLFTWGVAFPIGVYAATHQYSWGDHGLTLLGYVGLATPNFLLALVLLYFANVWFGTSIGGLMDDQFIGKPRSMDKLFSVLMGENVEQRRTYIEKHALEVKNLDAFIRGVADPALREQLEASARDSLAMLGVGEAALQALAREPLVGVVPPEDVPGVLA